MLAAMPIAIVVTIFLYPFWSWIEQTFAIESVGHSGPANWCFVAVYVVLAAGITTWLTHGRRSRPH